MVPWLFAYAGNLAEKSPELVEAAGLTDTAVAAGVSVALTGAILPIATLAPPIIERVSQRFENKPEAEALMELYRVSLLKAFKALSRPQETTPMDTELMNLWIEGLQVSTKQDPLWAA